jgi:hypothetical protein
MAEYDRRNQGHRGDRGDRGGRKRRYRGERRAELIYMIMLTLPVFRRR